MISACAAGLLVVAALVFANPAGASCGPGGCGRYHIHYVYFEEYGGTTADFSYASQYQWMTDASNAGERGYRQTSHYASVTVSDSTNDFSTTATFCDSASYLCVHTYSNGIDGQSGWQVSLNDRTSSGCRAEFANGEAERMAWAEQFSNIQNYVDGTVPGVSLRSPAGNIATVGCGP